MDVKLVVNPSRLLMMKGSINSTIAHTIQNAFYKCKHCQAKGVSDPDVEGAETGLINHLIS